MSFWNQTTMEPKRQFRWLMSLPLGTEVGGQSIPTFTIKSVTKPTFTVAATNVNFLAHTFKYPGKFTWNDITVTMFDPIGPDNAGLLATVLQSSGYRLPDSELNAQFSFSKAAAVSALGSPVFTQIDAGDNSTGTKPNIIEEWTLINAWIKSVNFGSTLNYTSEDLVELTLEISYDFATYRGTTTDSPSKVVDILTPLASPG